MSDPGAITGLHLITFVSNIQIPATVKYICSEPLADKYTKI